MSSSGKIFLKSAENETFEINRSAALALLSGTIKNFIEDGCAGDDDMVIPVPNIYSQILPKVLEYCKKHVNGDQVDGDKKGKEIVEDDNHADHNSKVEDLKEWEAKYMDIDQRDLYHLIFAAYHLNIKGLDLTVEKTASMIRGKTAQEIREAFNIKNDFTPEEEEQIQKENGWAFK